jgi:hypothetical protein
MGIPVSHDSSVDRVGGLPSMMEPEDEVPDLEDEASPERARGRPFRREGPAFPRNAVDELLVRGEKVEVADGVEERYFPSIREIAKRYGVAHSLIWRFAKERNCAERRRVFEERVRDRVDEHWAEETAFQIVFGRQDLLDTAIALLQRFKAAAVEGAVRVDTPADFKMLWEIREKELAKAEKEQANETGLPTLADLQASYARLRARDAEEEEARVRRRARRRKAPSRGAERAPD